MSKYSLQTECLENIEAYSDEQFNAEMAVVESAMAIFDKAILMMELSNSDIDLPDCSLFMESTFFQEQDGDPTTPQQDAGQTEENPAPAATEAPAQQSTNDGNKTDANKPAPTDAERKKYNSEHQFRQMNKKGNIENMFISIIAFIPRLLGFIIQAIVKFFKNLGNKETEKKAKDLANSSDEEKNKVAEITGDVIDQSDKENGSTADNNANATGNGTGDNVDNTGNGTGDNVDNTGTNNNANDNNAAGSNNISNNNGSVNVKAGTVKAIDGDAIGQAIQKMTSLIEALGIGGEVIIDRNTSANSLVNMIKNRSDKFINGYSQAKSELNNALAKTKEVAMDGGWFAEEQKIINAFNTLSATANRVNKEYTDFGDNLKKNGVTGVDPAFKPAKEICQNLKALAGDVCSGGIKYLTKTTNNYMKNIDAAYTALMQVRGQKSQPQEGGNPNGGEEQNNPANA